MADKREAGGGVHRAVPGQARIEGDARQGFRSGVQGRREEEEGGRRAARGGRSLLAEYQARLAAQDTWGVLVVLQALDAAGKDGTIRHVMSGVNPQGVAVHSFKVPRPRSSTTTTCGATPGGCPAVERSGSSTAPTTRRCWSSGCIRRTSIARSSRRRRGGDVWQRRYREINDWERHLSDNGFRIVKLFLNLSKEEQRTRFLRRIDLPDHNWKFSAADVARARALGRLPEGVLRDALAHEHRVGAVVRDTRRPQVVRPDRRRGSAGPHADGDRSAVPRGQQGAARDAGEVKQELEAQAPGGRAPDPFEQEQKARAGRERRPGRTRARPGRSRRRPTSRQPSNGRADGDGNALTGTDGRRRRLVRRLPRRKSPPGSASIRPSGCPASRPPNCCGQNGPNALPAEAAVPGMEAVRPAVPELHADHPAGRGDRVAGDQGVEHRRAAGPDHGGQRGRRAAPGGQGGERDERAEGDGQGDRAGPPRRVRGRDPGRGGGGRRRRRCWRPATRCRRTAGSSRQARCRSTRPR